LSLGIIGGLGPMATAYFMELLVKMTKAERDQDHLEMIIYNSPGIPDRTAYILGKSEENPLPQMIALGKKLREQNVSCVAIPCITAHYFHRQLQEGIGLPVIHAIRDTADTLKRAGIERVGIMATDGTIQSGIFQKEIENAGMQAVLPDEKAQAAVMSLIYDDVKAGKQADMRKFIKVREHLRSFGAQVVVLGCTELSVIKKDYELGDGIIDAMEVLSRSAILACGKELNPEYEVLFQPFC
jgi:aspartate racemase